MTNPKLSEVNFSSKKHSEVVKIGRTGGLANSPNKELAARIRGLSFAKSEKTKEKAVMNVVEMLLDVKLSQAHLLLLAEELKSERLTPAQRIKLLEVITKVHLAIHGQRPQVSVQFSGEDLAKRMVDEVFGEENG